MRRAALLSILCPVIAAAAASPAVASCAAPPPLARAIEDAPTVFVGTVTDTSNDDRWAVVDVSDVWKGDVAAQVEVRGGPENPPGPTNVASSIDRTFRDGETYLFLPRDDGDTVFRDDSCSSTTRYRESFERLRPAGVQAPETPPGPAPAPAPDEGTSMWWAAAALVAALAAGAVLFRRSRAA